MIEEGNVLSSRLQVPSFMTGMLAAAVLIFGVAFVLDKHDARNRTQYTTDLPGFNISWNSSKTKIVSFHFSQTDGTIVTIKRDIVGLITLTIKPPLPMSLQDIENSGWISTAH